MGEDASPTTTSLDAIYAYDDGASVLTHVATSQGWFKKHA
jgi:hypothetical protein